MAFSSDQALTYLKAAHQQQRLAHAFLFAGPEGSGKHELARDFFCAVNGLEEFDHHPDFHSIEPESKSRRILVEQVRALETGLRLRATAATWKFGVIYDADRLMPQASNAFLKTLEEPPGHSVLVLVTALPEALLDTIVSRCILIPLRPLGEPDLLPEARALLQAVDAYVNGNELSVTGALALARRFADSLSAVRMRIQSEHESSLKADQARYQQSTDGRWLEDREDQLAVLTESRYVKARARLVDYLVEWFGDAIRVQNGGATSDLPEFSAGTRRCAERYEPRELLRRMRPLEELIEHLGRNVQEALAIEVAFLEAFGPE
jgi:DNA polymerase III subunit delta'